MRKQVNGEWMFTDDASKAPEYKRGIVKCFLHADSIEREAGVLAELGLAGKACPAGSLASDYAKDSHGQHKHRQEYAAWQKWLTDKEKREDRAATREQLDATLAIARGGAEKGEVIAEVSDTVAETLTDCPVEDCTYTGTEPQVRGHKMGAHK